jgi:hypothetical protein
MHEGQAVTSRERDRRAGDTLTRAPAACSADRAADRSGEPATAGPFARGLLPEAGPRLADVIRLPAAAGQWALALPRPGACPDAAALQGLLAEILMREHQRAAARGQGPAVVRVPDSLLGPDLSGFLHHRPGRTVLYCPASRMPEPAAMVLTTLAARAGMLASPGGAPRSVAVIPVPHADFPGAVHPAVAMPGEHAEICICSGLVTVSLAAEISVLCTAHASLAAASAPTAPGQP